MACFYMCMSSTVFSFQNIPGVKGVGAKAQGSGSDVHGEKVIFQKILHIILQRTGALNASNTFQAR